MLPFLSVYMLLGNVDGLPAGLWSLRSIVAGRALSLSTTPGRLSYRLPLDGRVAGRCPAGSWLGLPPTGGLAMGGLATGGRWPGGLGGLGGGGR